MLKYSQLRQPLKVITILTSIAIVLEAGAVACQFYWSITGIIDSTQLVYGSTNQAISTILNNNVLFYIAAFGGGALAFVCLLAMLIMIIVGLCKWRQFTNIEQKYVDPQINQTIIPINNQNNITQNANQTQVQNQVAQNVSSVPQIDFVDQYFTYCKIIVACIFYFIALVGVLGNMGLMVTIFVSFMLNYGSSALSFAIVGGLSLVALTFVLACFILWQKLRCLAKSLTTQQNNTNTNTNGNNVAQNQIQQNNISNGQQMQTIVPMNTQQQQKSNIKTNNNNVMPNNNNYNTFNNTGGNNIGQINEVRPAQENIINNNNNQIGNQPSNYIVGNRDSRNNNGDSNNMRDIYNNKSTSQIGSQNSKIITPKFIIQEQKSQGSKKRQLMGEGKPFKQYSNQGYQLDKMGDKNIINNGIQQKNSKNFDSNKIIEEKQTHYNKNFNIKQTRMDAIKNSGGRPYFKSPTKPKQPELAHHRSPLQKYDRQQQQIKNQTQAKTANVQAESQIQLKQKNKYIDLSNSLNSSQSLSKGQKNQKKNTIANEQKLKKQKKSGMLLDYIRSKYSD